MFLHSVLAYYLPICHLQLITGATVLANADTAKTPATNALLNVILFFYYNTT